MSSFRTKAFQIFRTILWHIVPQLLVQEKNEIKSIPVPVQVSVFAIITYLYKWSLASKNVASLFIFKQLCRVSNPNYAVTMKGWECKNPLSPHHNATSAFSWWHVSLGLIMMWWRLGPLNLCQTFNVKKNDSKSLTYCRGRQKESLFHGFFTYSFTHSFSYSPQPH